MNPHADLTIENAAIWSDGLKRPASFAAVRDGRFVHVGDFDDAMIGPSTKRLDVEGRTMIPGLIDAHLHMLWGGVGLTSEIDLRPAESKADFIERIARWIESKNVGSGSWICGGRWSTEGWAADREPSCAWIDSITADRPCLLYRMDGHSALVNTAALRLAGITRDTPDPEGGRMVRNQSTGEPTGLLRESAIDLVSRFRPPPTLEQQIEGCHAAAREALRWGITAVGDIVEHDTLDAYRKLARLDPDTRKHEFVRFFMYVSHHHWDDIVDEVRAFQSNPLWVQIAGLKDYVDGSLGSQTAAMREPYLDGSQSDEPNYGLFMEGIREGRMNRNLEVARDASIQPIYHAIGDEASHVLLNALAEVYRSEAASRAARPRIEHAQHLLPEDVERFGRFGVVPSMQPYHKYEDARYMHKLIGTARCANAYVFRSLLAHGAMVAFGSDWPIVWMNPFAAIETAVRGTTAVDPAWHAEVCITIDQALLCYTTHAAYALRAEHELGRIAPGYRADFVVLNASPFEVGRRNESLDTVRPIMTAVDGRVVFES